MDFLTHKYNLVDAGRVIMSIVRENALKTNTRYTNEQILEKHNFMVKRAMEEAKTINYTELENEEQEDELESVSNYPDGQEDIDY